MCTLKRCGYQNGIMCFYDAAGGGAGREKWYAHLDFNSSHAALE